MSPLKKEISTPMLTIYGAGTILGAGIYVLIGKIAGAAGYWLPLAFLIAAVVASVNGLVYAELSTRRPGAGGPADYVQKAFHRRGFSVLLGWMIVATGLVSAATIANGFAGYLAQFADWPDALVKTLLLAALGGVAIAGARESAWFMAVTTTLGILGLLWVMYLGFLSPAGGRDGWEAYLAELPSLREVPVLTGLLTASFLAVYAFIGFEDIVHVAEDAIQPRRAIPAAIVSALLIAALFYVAVSVAALMVVDPARLAQSDAPLVEVNRAAGHAGWPLALLSLWIILNGALAQIFMASRVLFRLGRSGGAPTWMARVNLRTDTPVLATALATAMIIVLAVAFPLATLASATSLIMLLIFMASNAALIVLERREPEAAFDVPVFLPWIGLLITAMLIAGNFLVETAGH